MTAPDDAAAVWRDRTLAALASLADRSTEPPDELAVVEEVALHFADRFAPADRERAVSRVRPYWRVLPQAT